MNEQFLTIDVPGLCTLVVDHSRPGTRSLGVPVGGAADCWALAIGNALVGNPPAASALEVALLGPTIHASCDLACVVYGAPFTLTSTRQTLTAGRTFTLNAGEQLRIGAATLGMRAYFCVRGGIQTPEVLGSRSSFAPLQAGDMLPCIAGTIRARSLGVKFQWNAEPELLRVLDGPQADWFTTAEFYGQPWTITPSSNRMGLRSQGHPLSVPRKELVSEPVCPGAVQVTRDGQCIVLGVDGQTIGGYPKIAQVISADLDKLGQLRPGVPLRFHLVSLKEAEQLYHAKQVELREWLTRLRTSEPLDS